MYDQGLLTWQFPGMTNRVENISWSFIIILLINRKTMMGGGDFVTFSCFFDASVPVHFWEWGRGPCNWEKLRAKCPNWEKVAS